MKTARFIVPAILLAFLLAACAGPVSAPPTPDVNAIVAQTIQALTAGPNAGETPPVTPGLLPRAVLVQFAREMRWGP